MLPAGVLIAQVVKQYAKRRVRGVERRIVRGSADAVQALLAATQGKATAVINTAYIERLNATFRARLGPAGAAHAGDGAASGDAGGGDVAGGTVLQLLHAAPQPATGGHPAQAAGLTDHRWTVHELLTVPCPLPPVKRRGRPPHWLREVPMLPDHGSLGYYHAKRGRVKLRFPLPMFLGGLGVLAVRIHLLSILVASNSALLPCGYVEYTDGRPARAVAVAQW